MAFLSDKGFDMLGKLVTLEMLVHRANITSFICCEDGCTTALCRSTDGLKSPFVEDVVAIVQVEATPSYGR